MMDIIIQIMVEFLSILGIATKEIKQSRWSKYYYINMSPLTERLGFQKNLGRSWLEGQTSMMR
jgi:hypothetical protein